MTSRNTKPPRIYTSVVGMLVVSVILAALFVGTALVRDAGRFQDELRHDQALQAARALSFGFETALAREWDSLGALAGAAAAAAEANTETDAMHQLTDAVPRTGARIAWAGIVGLDGTVISGSARQLEGQDMSDQPWFRSGLEQRASMTRDGLVHIAAPVRDTDGQTRAVAVYAISLAWVRDFLAQAGDELGLTVLIHDRSGAPIIDTRTSAQPLPADLQGMIALRNTRPGVISVTDTGEGQVYAYARPITGADLPDFGWSLVVALDLTGMTGPLAGLAGAAIKAVAIAAAGVALAGAVILRHALRPVEQLASAASAIARNQQVYPGETNSSREAAQISGALVMIQSQLEQARRQQGGIRQDWPANLAAAPLRRSA